MSSKKQSKSQRHMGISTLVLDLETTDLNADRGVILCCCYESSKDPGKVHTLRQDEMNPGWAKGDRGNDKALVKAIVKLVKEHDVIVAHNGSRFDLPMLRTRALRWHLRPLKEVKLVDPCSISWRKYRLRSNSLGALADHLGIKAKKTPLHMSVWTEATLRGDKKSMNYIVDHCVQDIKVLSAVLEFVKPFIRVLDEKGSAL